MSRLTDSVVREIVYVAHGIPVAVEVASSGYWRVMHGSSSMSLDEIPAVESTVLSRAAQRTADRAGFKLAKYDATLGTRVDWHEVQPASELVVYTVTVEVCLERSGEVEAERLAAEALEEIRKAPANDGRLFWNMKVGYPGNLDALGEFDMTTERAHELLN